MKYLLIFLMIILISCGRQVTVETQDLVIEHIDESVPKEPIGEPMIVLQPFIGAYCTEDSVRSLFKNTLAAKRNSIHFADGKLKFINFYLLLEFCKQYNQYRTDHGFDRWRVNFDCDDFAQMFMIFLKMHIVSLDEQSRGYRLENPETFLDSLIGIALDPYRPEGIAVGEIWYSQADGEKSTKHAINILFLGPDNYLFIEPQDCRILTLTKDEINSIFFIRF